MESTRIRLSVAVAYAASKVEQEAIETWAKSRHITIASWCKCLEQALLEVGKLRAGTLIVYSVTGITDPESLRHKLHRVLASLSTVAGASGDDHFSEKWSAVSHGFETASSAIHRHNEVLM